MFSGNRTNTALTVALCAMLIMGLTGCGDRRSASLEIPDLSGPPPEAPPIPKWAYSRKYIKPVGMIPDVLPWAQGFWSKENRLFVIGSPDLPGMWERYYHFKEGGIKLRDGKPLWIGGKSHFPLWDPKTGKSIPIRGSSYQKGSTDTITAEFPTGEILFSSITSLPVKITPEHYNSSSLSQEVYNLTSKTAQMLARKPVPRPRFQYQLIPTKGRHYIYIKYEPDIVQDHDKREPHLILMQGELGKDPETELLDIKTSHRGRLIPSPDREHFFFVVNHCVDPNGPVEPFLGAGFLGTCSYIDYIDLKKKSFKTVGSFLGEAYKRKDGSTEVFKEGYGRHSIAIDEKRILAFGGNSSKVSAYRPIELFDLKTGKSEIVGQLPDELRSLLSSHSPEGIVRLSDGSVVIGTSVSLYLYENPTKQFSKLDDLILPRGEYGLVVSPDDKVYIAGGFSHQGDPRLIEMFDYKAYLKNKKGKV
jgi:hypothetical protein